ncbi:MAG: hypothetical protein ACK55I_19930, partial [bacterium]
LDDTGMILEANNLTDIAKRIAQYVPKTWDIDPNRHYENFVVPFKSLEDEFKENDDLRQKQPRYRAPDYRNLVGDEDENIEGLLHGPDSVPGPAYVDPGSIASNPGMAMGDLSDFTWEHSYEATNDSTNRWKNLIPNR